MKKITTLLLVLSTLPVFGTHLIGGYIQVRRVSASLTFEFSVQVYMDEVYGRTAVDQSNPISFCTGDGSGDLEIPRYSRTLLENGISLNVYKVTHTYSGTGSGTYTVSTQLRNRSELSNLPNALTVPLYLETTFSAAVVNTLPVFQGPALSSLTVPVNQKAMYNFQGKDADGDSVAHYLVRVRNGDCGKSSQALSDYSFPNDITRKGTFKVDGKTGQVTWDAPTQVGTYDFAIVAEEWRNGQRISTTLFDLVTRVIDQTGGNPGTIPPYEPALERGLLTALEDRIDDRDLSIAVYPSPSQNRFQIVLKSHKPTTASFQLLDSQGRIIQEIAENKTVLEHQQAIGNEQLAPGLYLIRTSARGRIYTNAVIKQ
ncbi:T9SS type A sorting domain-containing protein [Larkinella punicea]|uniref:T9SS C-terminal target domain-containing protein n=1 Tax=Larkinella punicea TaxID=2315727 RepID=A0A368JN80_9BACT|nr:T9SS type A sorting domain-containing protein [Larkinella punicea]RCR68033.1 T9SS C-terminal target domain-containing protein [Larkinella punicea]